MTTYRTEHVKCGICGALNEVLIVNSTNRFGYSDLDTRPPEMERSTMFMWIQFCGNCSYSSKDITVEIKSAIETIISKDYKIILKDSQLSPLVKKFLCYAMILEKDGDQRMAMFKTLHAAWVCDDNRNSFKALECRNKALSLMDKFRSGEEDTNIDLIKIDLLRRTEKFEEAIDFCKTLNFEGELAEVVRIQIELCLNKDIRAHTIASFKKIVINRQNLGTGKKEFVFR